MLFLRNSFSKIFLGVILLLFIFSPSIYAYDEEQFGFYSRTLIEHSEYDLSGTSYANFPQAVYFKDISYYQNDVTYITFYVPDSMIDTYPSESTGYQEDVEIIESVTQDIICNASISYSVALQGVYIHVYNIEDWDVGAHTGAKKITWVLDFNTANWHGLKIKSYTTIDSGFENETDIYIISSSTLPACEWADIHASSTWLNWYQQEETTYYPYQKLNITRTDGVTPYSSKWNISDGDTNIYSDSSLSSDNFSVILFEDITSISCIDKYNNVYSDTLSWVPAAPSDDGVTNTLSGMVVNAVDNTLLDEVNINLSSNTGYGGDYQDISNLGFYEITNIIDDNYNLSVDYISFESYQRDLELTENLVLNIPLIPADQVVLGTNLSGMYGIVSDHYTDQPVPNVIVRIENSTYSDFTSTNNNGYYEFVNITVGNYTVEANKVEYYPYQQKNLTTTTDDMLMHNFDMVLLVEPVDTVGDELEDTLGLDEVTEEDILHFFKVYGFWLFILALIFFMYAAYKSSGIDRCF